MDSNEFVAEARIVDSNEFVAEARIHELGRARDRAEIARQRAEAAARRAQALRLAADAELALRSPQVPTTVALALGAESVLTEPTPRGHRALRQVLNRHSRMQSRHNHDGLVFAVAFAPDGARVATACGDGSARVFDAATGTTLGRLDHDKRVVAVAFSPDGKWVATGSDDGSARVFDPTTGAELTRLDHDERVVAVVFAPDGTRVATASIDGSARVFDPPPVLS